jgi:hypothetical protein
MMEGTFRFPFDLDEMLALPIPRVSTEIKFDGVPQVYFSIFLIPRGSKQGQYMCAGCGAPLTGFLGVFQWGIRHGEGFCSDCGYPTRMYHVLKDHKGEYQLAMPLQYHPDEIAGWRSAV